MRKPPLNLLNTGAVATLFKLAAALLLPMLPLFFLTSVSFMFDNLILTPSASAAENFPRHKLSVRFDIDSHRINGVSQIELPAGTGADIRLAGLTVTSLIINNEKVKAEPGTNLLIRPAGTPHRLTIEYRKEIPPEQSGPGVGIISAKGITLTGFWHPILDQETIFELTASIPNNFEAVSEAEQIITKETATGKDVRFLFPYALSSINFIAGPYEVKKTRFGNGKELYTYFFSEDRDLVQGYREKTLAYLNRYEELLGDYPYKRFSVVENRLPTGFAMPTFTLLGQAVVRLPFITDTSLGHEVLHAWFGNSVRIKPEEGNWAEGLTTYLADQAYKEEKGEGGVFRKNQLIKYQSYVAPDNAMTLKEFVSPMSHSTALGKSVRAIGYSKCSMLFHMLRKSVGDKKFYEALRDFYAAHKHRQAGWTEIIKSFERAEAIPSTNFFHQWLEHGDIPEISASEIKIEEKDGRPVLSFTLLQDIKEPFELNVPITIVTPHEKINKLMEATGQSTEVEVPLPHLPTELIVDGDYDLMRHLDPAELPPVWSRFEGAAKKLAIVGSGQDAEIYAPLVELLTQMECRIVSEKEVTDKDLAEASLIFLGTGIKPARALFALAGHPASGFTIDIRTNPLNPKAVAVLVTSDNVEQTARGAAKLVHYGKYSYLHFTNGRIREKKIRETDRGLRYILDTPPSGIEIPNKLTFESIVDRLADKKVVYVGELHTRNEDHQLQLRIIRAMYNQDQKLAIGMEMFTKPTQAILDAYIGGQMEEWEFLKKSHYFKRWSFDYRLYRDIINFARRNNIPIIALNLEKKIVSKVFKEGGIAALSEEETELIPEERDLDLPGYRERIANAFTMHGKHVTDPNQVNDFFQAQSLWDETMAESVADYLRAHPDHRMVVVAGQGHTNKASGIPPRVARRLPVNQTVILNAQDKEIGADEADFLIFSPPAPLPRKPLLGLMLEESAEGVRVGKLSPHGKAGAAGVKTDDIIQAVNDEPIGAVEDLKIVMLYTKKGETVRLRIKRKRLFLPDRIMTVEVPL